MLPESVRNHAPVETAMNVTMRKIATPTRLARNLNPSSVDLHWRTQMSLAQNLALREGRIHVPLESLVLLTRRAQVICHHSPSLL